MDAICPPAAAVLQRMQVVMFHGFPDQDETNRFVVDCRMLHSRAWHGSYFGANHQAVILPFCNDLTDARVLFSANTSSLTSGSELRRSLNEYQKVGMMSRCVAQSCVNSKHIPCGHLARRVEFPIPSEHKPCIIWPNCGESFRQ